MSEGTSGTLAVTRSVIDHAAECMHSSTDLRVQCVRKVSVENALHLRHDVWDVPTNVNRTTQRFKSPVRRKNRATDPEVSVPVWGHAAERCAVVDEIAAGWLRQARRPTATEGDAWLEARRP
jgi:hypothetical protein